MAENNSPAPLKTAEGAYPALPEPVSKQFQGNDDGWYGFMDARHEQATMRSGKWPIRELFTAEQMRAYAAQAVEAQAAPAAVADWKEAARTMSVKIAQNCNSVPQLVFPFLYLGLKELFATPALPATGDSSAAAQAEVQAEPVAWANWRVGSTSYVPYRTRSQAQASVSQSEIAATQEGPYEVVPLYTAPQAQPTINPIDRLTLVAAAGLLAGHGYQESSNALQRVLDAAQAGSVIKWQQGVGLLWEVHAFGKPAHRVVSPLNWDAHGVYLALVDAHYSQHINVKLVSAANNNLHSDADATPQAQPADALDADQPEPADLWYLQDTRGYVGNDVLWWAKDGNGYTTDISKAHAYTRDDAFRQAAMRGTDRAWPKAYIDGKTRPAVDMQYIDHQAAMDAAQEGGKA